MTSRAFPKDSRLLKAADYNAVFKTRSFTVKHPSLRVIGRRSAPGTPARMGMVVAKRVLPRAVDRNRVKRHLRETFRHRASTLPAVDLVVQPLSAEVLNVLPDAFEQLLDRVVAQSI